MPCDPDLNCATCQEVIVNKITVLNCITCSDKHYFYNSLCLACNSSVCKNCLTHPTSCTTCP